MASKFIEVVEEIERTNTSPSGETIHTLDTKRKSKKIQFHPEEMSYVREYTKYLYYLLDMPRSHSNLMKLLLHHYVSPANKGMEVSLTVGVKHKLMEQLNIQNIQSLNNLVTSLVKGGCLIRLDTGLYRANPWFWGIGKWVDVNNLQEITPPPLSGTTYAIESSKPKSPFD